MRTCEYIHGYSKQETNRLYDQAGTLAELLHSDTLYPPGSRILEAGCGTGAQTLILASNNPKARIISIDVSVTSLRQAKKQIKKRGIKNVSFQQGDIFSLAFEKESFDHIFVCFVLEHLRAPLNALKSLKGILKKGGSITVIEGDHGSAFYYPRSADAQLAIQCLIELQARAGGDSLIGRRLYPLLLQAGFRKVCVSPRFVYADSSRPKMVEGFTKKTFTAMVKGVKKSALAAGLTGESKWDKGIADLYRTAEKDGTFCYTFFKAVGNK
jgi:ubiquinone/menaquinone biosynthesis C-methylase UbiE